jgi:hypothetical protein
MDAFVTIQQQPSLLLSFMAAQPCNLPFSRNSVDLFAQKQGFINQFSGMIRFICKKILAVRTVVPSPSWGGLGKWETAMNKFKLLQRHAAPPAAVILARICAKAGSGRNPVHE